MCVDRSRSPLSSYAMHREVRNLMGNKAQLNSIPRDRLRSRLPPKQPIVEDEVMEDDDNPDAADEESTPVFEPASNVRKQTRRSSRSLLEEVDEDEQMMMEKEEDDEQENNRRAVPSWEHLKESVHSLEVANAALRETSVKLQAAEKHLAECQQI